MIENSESEKVRDLMLDRAPNNPYMSMTYVTSKVICGRKDWYSLLVYLGKEEYKLYDDLTCDLEKLQDLSLRINDGKVSVLHIDDIIEDFLD